MESPLQNVLTVLENGRQDVLVSVRDVSDEKAASKPGPERWSALECMEHIIVVEDRFLGWIVTGGVNESPQADSEKESRLLAMVTDRSNKAQAPAAVVPTGQYSKVSDAIAAFNAARDRSVQVARSRGQELYGVKVTHPRFGEMNGAELLHLVSGHASRHAAQIREALDALKS